MWRALREMGVPCVPLKPLEIAQGGLSDKRLLLVPGGSARQKFTALGPEGRQAVRDFVARGGHYLGFCGGAGLGLTGDDGLGLCPWRRAEFQDRLPHLLSGHVPVQFTGHAASPAFFLSKQTTSPALPVWWPGRFQADETDDRVQVLARYHLPPGEDIFPPDMLVADLPLRGIPPVVLENWREQGVELPPHLHSTPCVVRGTFGEGGYVLSYSHLETPNSPLANEWFASLIEDLAGIVPVSRLVPQWEPEVEMLEPATDGQVDPTLLAARKGMSDMLRLAKAYGLMFGRTPWLIGWRAGTPGSALNTLHLILHTLVSSPPSGMAHELWQSQSEAFAACFWSFVDNAEWCLLTQRLSATLSASQSGARLAEQVRQKRIELFGTAMRGGGIYQTLLDMLEPVLFEVVRGEEQA